MKTYDKLSGTSVGIASEYCQKPLSETNFIYSNQTFFDELSKCGRKLK